MAEHPVTLFVFCLANFTSALGFLFIAFGLLPRARIASVITKGFAITTFVTSALAHIGFALTVLFNDKITAEHQAANPLVLGLHLLLAISMWVFIFGVTLQVGRYVYVDGPPDAPGETAEIVVATPASPQAQMDALDQQARGHES